MSKFLHKVFSLMSVVLMMAGLFSASATAAVKETLPNPNFEDWSGTAFDGEPQPKGWNASNVEQVGMKFNFAHREAGHNGGYCMMVQDQDVGAMGITATSPGYFSLGKPWAYLPSITQISQATAGTAGGVTWTSRPDSMSVWIKRTGSNWQKEDFYLLYYAWSGTARGDKYKNKNGGCTSVTYTNEESDIRLALNGNECGTAVKVTQVAEGMWRERKQYGDWTNIRVPIYYMNNEVPTNMNIIFSASNYPNFRANDGLYAGNSLYVDDVELIYSSKIQKLYINDLEWKGFDPNSTDVQVYSLGENATSIPSITAMRGIGSITNAHGTTVAFNGRTLSGSEIKIENGDLVSTPTKITVYSEDGKSTTVYKIQFQKAASSNAKLAGISYQYGDVTTAISGFSPAKYNYTVDLPYGTTTAPTIVVDKQEDAQTVSFTQPSALSDVVTITVTAANGTAKATYTLNFRVAALADNTLQDILVNGKSVPGFTPSQGNYKVSLPVGTTEMPQVTAVSAYPQGEQTIVHKAPSTIDGGTYQLSVTTPGNQVAKVYKLNFKLEASSYTNLKMIYLDGAPLSHFEPEITTYYVGLPLGTSALPAITWEAGDDYQTVTKTEGGLNGTTRITVVAGNGDQLVYKIVFSTETSGISTLAGITIGGQPLADFAADKTSYTYALPVGATTLPTIEPVKGDEYQTYSIAYGDVNGTTRITVTADDGSITVYQIAFSVAAFTDNTLNMIYVDGNPLEGFAPETNEYYYNLEKGTTALPEITYDRKDDNLQTVTTRSGGVNGDYRITVRPQSGASRTYIIHFSVATSANTALAMIKLDGVDLEGFDPETTHYTVNLPEGVSTIPAVTYVKAEAAQRVLSVLEDTTQTITVTAESGAKREYKIDFHISLSANAFLEMIYVDGVALADFAPEQTQYIYQLTTDVCPAVTVAKAPGQQVTITTPVGAGKAVILVAPEQGATQTYSIDFRAKAAAGVQLQGIALDGVALAGFEPTKTHYAQTYTKQLPVVTYTADPDLTVEVLWHGDTAYLHVADTSNMTTIYDLVFTRIYDANTQLAAIKADGALIEGFTADKKHYSYELPAGSTYPALSYEKADEAQTVVFGQTGEGKWRWLVTAEKGDTASYTVTYTIAQYSDATLENIQLIGLPEGQTFTFVPTTFTYSGIVLDEGAPLLDMQITARPKQTVLSFAAGENEQQILVMAENGASSTYSITYSRKQSSNALLQDIKIDGVSLAGFSPETYHYVDTLAWRSAVIPNVFPVGQLENQTITTEISRINETTTITVEAQDGTTKVYTIDFPVRKSSNTALENLYAIDSLDNYYDLDFRAEKTDYEIVLPYQSTVCPPLTIEKQEPEQRIDIISRPLGDTTQVIVVAENGDKQTYNVLFRAEEATEDNRLSMIRVNIDDNPELEKELNLKDKTKRDFEIEVPFGSRTLVVEYEKMYAEQTVLVQPGGVNHPTVITVKANRGDEADEVYTITPTVPTEDPAVLTDIKVNGTTITGFTKEQFSYIVPVTSKPILRYTLNKGAEINILVQTSKHWQAEVTYGNRTNVYDVWYYYSNEQVPNADFTQWSQAAVYTSTQKPTGWNGVPDALGKHSGFGSFTPDDLIKKNGTSVVDLRTKYSTPGGGNIPGFITLGNVTGAWGVAGSTSFSISGGIAFHNSPDVMQINYRLVKVNTNSQIQYILTGSDGEKTLEWNNSSESSNYQTFSYDLKEANNAVGDPTLLNIVLNSYYQTDGTTGNPLVSVAAEMYVDWIRFSYNHTLTGIKVDGIAATKSGNAFTATLTDPERIEIPILVFTGEVEDQAQKVTWSAPAISGNYSVRNATIRNYAENGTDYTDYTLKVQRPLDTRNTLSDLKVGGVSLTGFAEATGAYTVHLKPTVKHLPDVQPVAKSSLQTITTAYADSTMTITVTPEKGTAKVYTVRFVTDLSDDTSLAVLKAGTEVLNVAERNHTIEATYMPDVTFVKRSDLQQVSVVNGVVTVTAENGAVGTYTITHNNPAIVLGNGQLKEFELDGAGTNEIGLDKYALTRERPAHVSFERVSANDHVVFVQTPTRMEWQVTGDESHTYVLTYPTEVSSDATLSDILIEGEHYSEYSLGQDDYSGQPIVADTTIRLVAVAREKQTLETTQAYDAAGVSYTIDVTAEDGVSHKQYKLRVTHPISANNSLDAILLNGELLAGFHPDTLAYTIALPSPTIKRQQPAMPSIGYAAGQSGQQIEVTEGGLGQAEPTLIRVTAENGSSREYSVTVLAEPSHNADLTGIMINGIVVDHFEPGRHYYSLEVNSDEIEIVTMADDRFQTVQVSKHGKTHTVHVTAEDGVTTSDYNVDIIVQNLSNDATLSNILLDGDDFTKYLRDINPLLAFDPLQHAYVINMPSGATVLPEITAQLKMDGQQVEIAKHGMVVTITVTAIDGSTNAYTLSFETPKSKDARLSMIFLDGDSLQGFSPDYYFYQVELPVGVHAMPEVVGQKGESHQIVYAAEMDTTRLQATIHVKPEDPYTTNSSYVIAFHFTQSSADTLQMIYADGDSLKGFAPQTFFYNDSLPVGTTAFPELSWAEFDPWQTIRLDTVSVSASQMIRQLFVTAESGKTRTYTVSYTIRKSEIDTLQAIFVDNKTLPDFDAYQTEYYYELTAAEYTALAGAAPVVEYIAGDDYQTVYVTQALDSLSGKSLGIKTLVTVTAATGAMRTYTIHYPVQHSTDATLNMILLGGKPLSNFDAEKLIYKESLSQDADLPLVTWVTKEAAQVVDLQMSNDTVNVLVTAEDGVTKNVYTIVFERLKSSVTMLRDVVLTTADGQPLPTGLFAFRPETYEYTIVMPYDPNGGDVVPEVEAVLYDAEQTVTEPFATQKLANGDVVLTIHVVAPNGEDEADYVLTFHFTRNNDAWLTSIMLKEQLLPEFDSKTTEYTYVWPFGTEPSEFFTLEDVTYQLSDTLAADTAWIDADNTLFIRVIAQDGVVENTYTIFQVLGKDADCSLAAILLDGDTIRGFDSNVTFYTYYLLAGLSAPAVEALPRSENATVSIIWASDTCAITCLADDGSIKRYYVHFPASTIDETKTANENDVLVKRVPGASQLFVATIRRDVTFALYDRNGHLAYYEKVPVADPNDAVVVDDPSTTERLSDVIDTQSGLIVDVIPGEVYFYVFFGSENARLKSGKLIALP